MRTAGYCECYACTHWDITHRFRSAGDLLSGTSNSPQIPADFDLSRSKLLTGVTAALIEISCDLSRCCWLWDDRKQKGKTVVNKWTPRIVAALAAPVVAISFSGAASASDHSVSLNNSSVNCRGSIGGPHEVASLYFVDSSNTFRLWDACADGHGVRSQIQGADTIDGSWVTMRPGTHYVAGDGVSTHFTIPGGVPLGSAFRMRVCTVDGASDPTPVACSGWKSLAG